MQQISLRSLLGLLNSNISTYFLKQVSSAFRGGYIALNKQYIEQLPIAFVAQPQQVLLERVVDYLIWLSEHLRIQTTANAVRDTLMLGWWEQLLNGLVYELYFPSELHAAHIHLFELIPASSLPELNTLPESERLLRLRAEFERTYDTNHPLRGAVFNLGSLETVRVIEGRE